jgi:hypothetical protein
MAARVNERGGANAVHSLYQILHPGGQASIAASLSHKSDGQVLCNMFTVKRWHG